MILKLEELFEVQIYSKIWKKKERKKIKPTGFIIGKKNLYLATSTGRLLIAGIENGQTISIIKLDSEKISRPVVLKESLFIFIPVSILSIISDIDVVMAATVWLVLRVIYCVLYYLGISYLRTIVWFLSVICLFDMAIRIFKHAV